MRRSFYREDLAFIKEIAKNFPKIEKFFTTKSLEQFVQTPYHKLDEFNDTLGTMIRLKILRSKKTLARLAEKGNTADKDALALRIIQEYYRYSKLSYFSPRQLHRF